MLNAATVQYLPPLRISQYNYHTTLIPYKQRQVYRRQEGRDGGRTSPKPSGSVPLIIYGEGRGQNIPQTLWFCPTDNLWGREGAEHPPNGYHLLASV